MCFAQGHGCDFSHFLVAYLLLTYDLAAMTLKEILTHPHVISNSYDFVFT